MTDGNNQNATQAKGDHTVGYGKPPKATRFKPGQSGNPKGRPKIQRNLLDLVGDLLENDIGTESRVVFGNEAIHRATIKAALGGNQRAFKRFVRLAKQCGMFKDISNRHKPVSGVVFYPYVKPDVEKESARLRELIKEVDAELAELKVTLSQRNKSLAQKEPQL